MKTHNVVNRCYKNRKYTVCMRVRASFSPEILQAGAVTGFCPTGRTGQTKSLKLQPYCFYIEFR